MAFDYALDRETGDWVFSSTRDLLGVMAVELDQQRIWIRSKIPRGTFMYDEDGTLGSNLHLVSRSIQIDKQAEEIRAYLTEALAGMEAVQIKEIIVQWDEERDALVTDIRFIQTGSLDDEIDGTQVDSEESVLVSLQQDIPDFASGG